MLAAGGTMLHLAAERAEAVGDERADAPDALDVAAARLDRDQVAQRVEQRLLLALRLRAHRVGRLALCSHRECDDAGEQEDVSVHAGNGSDSGV